MFTKHDIGEVNTVNDTFMQTIIPLKKLLGLHIQQGHFPKKLILSYSFPYQKLNSWLAQFTSFPLNMPFS